MTLAFAVTLSEAKPALISSKGFPEYIKGALTLTIRH
jgi:hypothetical protein